VKNKSQSTVAKATQFHLDLIFVGSKSRVPARLSRLFFTSGKAPMSRRDDQTNGGERKKTEKKSSSFSSR
jgi:hypothetical protein